MALGARVLTLGSGSPARALLRSGLPAAVVLTVLAGLVYATLQQDLRQSANDPQIQMAEDGAASLAAGQSAQSIVGPGQVDMAASLAPYVIVFDAGGRAVAASVRLDGVVPALPAGVAAYMAAHSEDRITWQPKPGVRSAAVLRQVPGANGGFVLAGRSLREVEGREQGLLHVVAAAWLVGMAALVAVVLCGWLILDRGPILGRELFTRGREG